MSHADEPTLPAPVPHRLEGKVAIADIDEAGAARVTAEIRDAGLRATAIGVDVSDEESCRASPKTLRPWSGSWHRTTLAASRAS